MKRLFIGIRIDVSENIKALVSGLKLDLKSERIRWVESHNLHITLAFLGDIEEERIGDIVKAIGESAVSYESFNITLKGIGVFRSLSYPRVIWLGSESADKLTDLRNGVVTKLTDSGLYNDQGRFSPHVTLGRMKGISDKKLLERLTRKYGDKPVQKQPVNRVILFESILRQGAPVYREIFSSALVNS